MLESNNNPSFHQPGSGVFSSRETEIAGACTGSEPSAASGRHSSRLAGNGVSGLGCLCDENAGIRQEHSCGEEEPADGVQVGLS